MSRALLAGALVLLALPALADSNVRIVRLSFVDGDVDMDRGDGRGFQPAVLNMPVVQGARLATRDGATAEVEFEDGSTARLTPNTSIAFQTLSLRTSGERVTGVELADGTAYFDLKEKKDDFTVTAAGQTIAAGKSARFRLVRDRSQLRVAVFKGDAEVRTSRGVSKVKKNETFLADSSEPERDQLAKGIDADSYDSWAEQREQYQQTYASNHDHGYSSQYRYGWSDLNYFGGFSNYPGYGYLWRPFGVTSMWDPFADGAWMAYPGSGWMFVSAYPWGWTPYRYGRWMFVPGFGWAWQPGLWNQWYATPVIYGAPAGYVAPHPPAAAGGVVVVGGGPMHGVKDPRFGKWVENAGAHPGMHGAAKASVGPVAIQAPAATPPAKTTGTATGNAAPPSAATGHKGEGRRAAPPKAPPSGPSPRGSAPQRSVPPPASVAK